MKVLRPGVKEAIDRDIQVLHEMARFARRYTEFGSRNDLEGMVTELETSVREDMDFRQTAANTRLIGRQIAGNRTFATAQPITNRTRAIVARIRITRTRVATNAHFASRVRADCPTMSTNRSGNGPHTTKSVLVTLSSPPGSDTWTMDG